MRLSCVLFLLICIRPAISQVSFGKIDLREPTGEDPATSIQSRFLRITPNRDVNAVVSGDDLHLQLGFKYQLWDFERSCIPRIDELFVGYSMKGFWDVPDQCFENFNHNFELFWEVRREGSDDIRLLRIGLWEHESDGENGVSGVPDTASWDRHYLQAILGEFSDAGMSYNLDIKIWRQFASKSPFKSVEKKSPSEHNPDGWSSDYALKQRLGFFELRPVVTYMGTIPDDVPFRFQIAATMRKWGALVAEGDRNGSIQVDAKWAVPIPWNPLIYVRFFRGYGVDIHDFKDKQSFEDHAFVPGGLKFGLQLKH